MGSERTSLGRVTLYDRFFVVTAGVLLAIALVGFSPSFFLKVFFQAPGAIEEVAELLRNNGGVSPPGGVPELPLYVLAHGAVLTAWFVLFFVQTLLIASDRRDLHRRLGVVGLLLAVPVVVVSAVTNLLAIPRIVTLASLPDASVVLADNLPLICANFATLMIFTISVGCAAYFRRRPQIHKHFMLWASVIMVLPALDRMWGWSGVENAMEVWFPLSELTLVVAVIGSDWLIRRRPPWVLLGSFVVLFILGNAAAGFGTTDTARSWALALMN